MIAGPAGWCPPTGVDYQNDDFGWWLRQQFASRYVSDHYAYAVEYHHGYNFHGKRMSVRSRPRSRVSMPAYGY